MNTHKYKKMCKGCLSDRICGIQQYSANLVSSCPCRKCLVKGVCFATCQPYKEISHPIFNSDDIKYSGCEDKKL